MGHRDRKCQLDRDWVLRSGSKMLDIGWKLVDNFLCCNPKELGYSNGKGRIDLVRVIPFYTTLHSIIIRD